MINDRLVTDNRDLTMVGPGTIMGNLMRRYWLPALMSSELKAGGAPVRLLLLGEKLVAFRSPSGEIGVIDHLCPHRNASLFFGRNEEGGLRCIYHGWQFNAAGACVDVPNTPATYCVKEKVKTTAYKAFEKAGIVWVYMGDAADVPSPPQLEITDLEEGAFRLEFVQRECNYLQALEGDLDTSHFGFLHAGNIQPEELPDDGMTKYVVANRAPELEVSDAPWGTTYCAFRDADNGAKYLRYANFLFPCWSQPPQGMFETNILARAWVPMDDTHTMSVTLMWIGGGGQLPPMKNGKQIPGHAPQELLPNTTDWLGRFRAVQNRENDYLIDRDAQHSNSLYSGILNISMQDQAVTESMGPIAERTHEHLTPSDLMISRTRRRLLRAARELASDGTQPPGVRDPLVYRDARSGEMVVPEYTDLFKSYNEGLLRATRPTASRTPGNT